MTERIIDISDAAAYLHARSGLLVIEPQGAPAATVPFPEVAALVLAHPHTRCTQAALSGLSEAGACVVVCNAKFLPVGMLLPLAGHGTQGERFRQQAAASRPTRKRLWKQIVQAKIRNQSSVLRDLRGDDAGLRKLVSRVRSGDPQNVEAWASRRYWRHLFPEESFRRNPDADDQNRFLNYGYAVARAIVARALCAAGLHPGLGIHHHNRYDAYCLADDLLEPLRPVVDRVVARLCQERGTQAPMDHDTKAAIIGALTGRLDMDGESRTLFDLLARTAASLAAVLAAQRKDLVLPEL
ncbi:MAG: type II CRISPR-associated endonuclease Cas1 [bacterium]